MFLAVPLRMQVQGSSLDFATTRLLQIAVRLVLCISYARDMWFSSTGTSLLASSLVNARPLSGNRAVNHCVHLPVVTCSCYNQLLCNKSWHLIECLRKIRQEDVQTPYDHELRFSCKESGTQQQSLTESPV